MVEIQEDRIDQPPLKILVNEKILEIYGWTAESLAAPVPENNYGLNWPAGTDQYFKELWAYKKGGIGGHDKLYHLVNAIKLDLPFFQFTNLGYINSNALRVLKACCERTDLGIAGAASTGKTYPVGAYILEDWKSAPNKTLSFVCTTSMSASEDRIWGAIVKMYQNSKFSIGTYIPHKHVIAWGNFSDAASDRDFNAAIKALAIEQGEDGKKAIDVTRGRKQKNVRLVFDELPEMELYVTQASINLESNTPDKHTGATGLQVIGIGNPNKPNDAHGEMCKPDHPLGYKSVTKETPEWKTRTGWCIFLNGEWSPNFETQPGEQKPFPGLTSRETLANMLVRCHGNRDSLDFWRNAIGFWPDSSVIQTVLTEDLIESRNAHSTKIQWQQAKRKQLCGFDPGFTSGGDKCAAQFGEIGLSVTGRQIALWKTERIYLAPAFGVFEDEIAKQVVDDCIKFGVEPDGFGMDISGDGGKMLQAIIRYWITRDKRAVDIFAISSMGKPTNRILSNVDPRRCDEAFDRRVSEYWMMVREAVLCEVIRGLPLYTGDGKELTAVATQLCSRVYSIKGRKFSIESKDEMKKRTSGASPDEADAFVYFIEMARRHGLVFLTPDDIKRYDHRRKEEKQNVIHDPVNEYGSDDWGEDAA